MSYRVYLPDGEGFAWCIAVAETLEAAQAVMPANGWIEVDVSDGNLVVEEAP